MAKSKLVFVVPVIEDIEGLDRKPFNSSLSFDFIGLWVRPTLIKEFQIGLRILELELNFLSFHWIHSFWRSFFLEILKYKFSAWNSNLAINCIMHAVVLKLIAVISYTAFSNFSLLTVLFPPCSYPFIRAYFLLLNSLKILSKKYFYVNTKMILFNIIVYCHKYKLNKNVLEIFIHFNSFLLHAS